jgi:hypothetical protein
MAEISGIAFLALAAVGARFCLDADQVKQTNGDTITGVLVKKDRDGLTLHSEFMGDVSASRHFAMPRSRPSSIGASIQAGRRSGPDISITEIR